MDGSRHCMMLSQDPDGSSQLVLLDYGQCKALPAHRLRALANLIIALDDGDRLTVALAMSGFGMDFNTMLGGVADPLTLIRTVAYIIFDTRWKHPRPPPPPPPSYLPLASADFFD
jgi:hypothetical protein